jgi:tripartite-type tricarboxylate transporter receptor subunit TctC
MRRLLFFVLWATLWGVADGRAQSSETTFAGKTITLYIGNSIGGGYDLYARAIARHLPKHIPGSPTILPKNMEGGGSLRAANFMADVAPRDGTAIATIGRGTAFATLMGQKGATFDATTLSWIASANEEVSVCAAWHTSGIRTLADLKARDLVIGSTLATDDASQLPKLMNGIFGTRFKLVLGYPGGNEMNMAMERGETQGRCGLSWASFKATHPEWVAKKQVMPLFQVALAKSPELNDVPLLLDEARTPEERMMLMSFAARQAMGRPFFAPPGIPAPVLDLLRRAFDSTLSDPEFRAEADQTGLEINPVRGARVAELVSEIYRTPPDVVRRMIELSN